MEQKSSTNSPTEQDNAEMVLLNQRTAFHKLMAECNDCQEEIEPNWQFCAHCGTRLATRCPGCGNPLPPAGATACLHCGLAIPQIHKA